jgi:hypothetical protein
MVTVWYEVMIMRDNLNSPTETVQYSSFVHRKSQMSCHGTGKGLRGKKLTSNRLNREMALQPFNPFTPSDNYML